MAGLFIAPAVLRWARETIGFDINEAADVSKQRADVIAGWEVGASRPTLAQVKSLAAAYRRQLATLLLREPPAEDEPSLPDFRRRTDYSPPRLPPGVHLAIRDVRRHQLAFREIASVLNFHGLRTEAPSTSDFEALAEEWRVRLGISVRTQERWEHAYDALRAWRNAVESVGTIVLQLPLGDDAIRGLSIADSVVPAIALNTDDSASGRCFTLFHELFHLLLGRVGICEPRGAMRYESTSLEDERLCNRFAGAFLVPLPDLAGQAAARHIADMQGLPAEADFTALRRTFKVSTQVIWYRLHDAGLVDDNRYYALWAVWANQPAPDRRTSGGGQDRAERALSRYGRTFVTSMLEAESRGFIDLTAVLRYTRVRAEEIPRLAELASAQA